VSIEVVFETHSLTTDNENGVATGWLDGHLSETGRRLAAELGARRRGETLAAVFTSDLGRAVETTKIAFGGSGVPTYEDQRLRECNYGSLNGMPVTRLDEERLRLVASPFRWNEGWVYRLGPD
jgi:broad specificity phosphatase PhoE